MKHIVIVVTVIVNAMRFNEAPLTCQCKNENKKAKGFQISRFYWPFLSDIMAVKGLTPSCLQRGSGE